MVGFINPRLPLNPTAQHSLVAGPRPRHSQAPQHGRTQRFEGARGSAGSTLSAADVRSRKSIDKDALEFAAAEGLSPFSLVDSLVPGSEVRRRSQPTDGPSGLPKALIDLQDPSAPVMLPPPGEVPPECLDNWKLDMLISGLGKNRATWRRSLMLFEWLKASGHAMDDRLCTTLIRICSDHGDAVGALSVYDWMVAPTSAGGGQLSPTTFTYTAAMRAALSGGMLDRAMQVWNAAWGDSQAGIISLDARLCITYIELCARLQLTDEALQMYARMRAARPGSRMALSVHGYTAVMRAASEGGAWYKALDVWEDMQRAGCEPTGHTYAAAISACAVGQDWRRAVGFFDEMTQRGIKPDVVSCTALITALATAGEADKAQSVVTWMLANGVRPNARTYTALLTALGNAKQWARAVETLRTMQLPESGGVTPNAYTYSALLKSLGEHGQWQLAEAVFSQIERTLLAAQQRQQQQHGADGMRLGRGLQQPASSFASPFIPPMSLPAGLTSGSAPAAPSPAASSSSRPAAAAAAAAGGADAAKAWTRASQLHGLSLNLWDPQAPSQQQQQQQSAAGASGAPHAASPSCSSSPSSPLTLTSHPIRLNGGDAPEQQGVHQGPNTAVEAAAAGSASSSSAATATSPSATLSSTPSPSSSSLAALSSSLPLSPACSGSSFSLFSTTAMPSAATSSSGAAAPDANVPQATSGSSSGASGNGSGDSGLGNWWQVTLSQLDLLAGGGGAGSSSGPAVAMFGRSSKPTGGSSSMAGWNDTAPAAGTYIPAATGRGPAVMADGGNVTAGHGVAAAVRSGPDVHHHAGNSEGQVVNEVVCGALMLAYERAGKWQEAVNVLVRALNLGIQPNTVMYNTAISAAGKAGQLAVAEKLYAKVRVPDAVTHETLIAAYGMAGLPEPAEAVLARMAAGGFRPRDYAYCGLVAAYSLSGDCDGALRVLARMKAAGAQPTVHVYNALLAACERARQADRALKLYLALQREGLEPNAVTHQIMAAVGRLGVASVESQQVAAAAVSAAVAAYGTLLIQTGQF